MRRLALALLLLMQAGSAAAGVHMVLKVEVPARQAVHHDEIVAQCMEVVNQRLGEFGIKPANVALDRPDGIVVDLPNYSDTATLRDLFDFAGQSVSFRLVDEDIKDRDILAGRVPDGVEVVEQSPSQLDAHPPPLALYRAEIISSERISDAAVAHDKHDAEPMVVFQLDDLGRMQLETFTAQNFGKRFAIVWKGKIVSAPWITEVIRGGSVQIRASFTEQQASRLSVAFRAGAMPAPWTIVELKQTP